MKGKPIMRLENEPPRWNPRNRKPLIFLGFFRSSDASSPLYLSCLSLRFPAGFWRRFQAKSYMESCPSGRRCSTRNAVKSNLPRVRIPNSPPAKPYRSRLNSDKVLFSFARGRERCDRNGHAVFLRPEVDFATTGSEITGISTSSTKLK